MHHDPSLSDRSGLPMLALRRTTTAPKAGYQLYSKCLGALMLTLCLVALAGSATYAPIWHPLTFTAPAKSIDTVVTAARHQNDHFY